MSRVLINVLNNGEGGAEQCLRMIARYYAQQNVNVDVLILNHNMPNKFWDAIANESSFVRIFKSKKSSELLGFFYLLKFYVKCSNYDLIFTSHLKMTMIIGTLMRLGIISKTKFVARESNSSFLKVKGVKKKVYRWLYLIGYKKVDLLICQTDSMKKQFDDNIPEYLLKSLAIKNPIDLKLINKKENDINTGELKWLQSNDYIVAAGRLIYLKGYDLLIESFKIINEYRPNLKLLILGEGEGREELTYLINRLDLGGEVFLKGFIDNVYPYFNKAALCVVSSRSEGFPNVLLQMMSQNKNVVSTKCAGGIDEIPGVYSCDVSVNSLTDSMKKCLENDNDSYKFEEYLMNQSIENFITIIEQRLES